MATIGTAPVSAPAIARTYAHPSYADPWECVEDYQRVLEYTGGNPDKGSTAVASALDLPRSRIRPWIDGAIPDPVRCVQVADAHGWLVPDVSSPVFRGLNVLVAWIFSGGSIKREYFVPHFVADDDGDETLLHRAAEVVGVELDFTRAASDHRARELRPGEHASVLGRVLTVLGAPVGDKNAEADVSFPGYLQSAPALVRREFASVYVTNRGNVRAGGATSFREERPRAYLRSLAEYLRAVTGEPVSLNEKNVYLTDAAANSIHEWPSPLADLD